VSLSANNYTYLFTPQSTILPLFDYFDMDFPQSLKPPLNFSSVVDPKDTLPRGLNTTDISIGGARFHITGHCSSMILNPIFLAQFWNNGVAHSMKSTPVSLGMFADRFLQSTSFEFTCD
jgi:hypothetical protein